MNGKKKKTELAQNCQGTIKLTSDDSEPTAGGMLKSIRKATDTNNRGLQPKIESLALHAINK